MEKLYYITNHNLYLGQKKFTEFGNMNHWAKIWQFDDYKQQSSTAGTDLLFLIQTKNQNEFPL